VLSGDGQWLYASNWRGRTVAAIRTRGGGRRTFKVGEHPTGIAMAGNRLLVANSNDATLSSFRGHSRRASKVNLALVGRRGDSPNAIATTRNGRTAYVSLGGDNAVAVLKLRGSERRGVWRLAGLIPTG